MGVKLGFTTSAVTEFFRILGEQNVPEDKLTLRLVEIATHFSQTRNEMAALDPEDPGSAELVHEAKAVLDAGRLTEAEGLLGRARTVEMAAYRHSLELRNKAQEAEERHALNGAKLMSSEGQVALTQLHYMQAADDFGQAAALVPSGHKDEHVNYLGLQASALYRQGNESATMPLSRAPSRFTSSCWRKGGASRCRSIGQRRKTTSASRSTPLARARGRRHG
jgi:hypothetical protein